MKEILPQRNRASERKDPLESNGAASPFSCHVLTRPIHIVQAPVAVLFHGGFWKQQWNVDNTPLVSLGPDLLAKGFGVVEVEYRRRDDEGGGWPGTNEDALLALNSLQTVAPDECASLDLTNVTLIGHSAGGCLVLWLAAQQLQVRLALVVAVAPVCDLNEGFHLRLSDEGDAVEKYMKCTPETEDGLVQYALASPAEFIPRIQVNCPRQQWHARVRQIRICRAFAVDRVLEVVHLPNAC